MKNVSCKKVIAILLSFAIIMGCNLATVFANTESKRVADAGKLAEKKDFPELYEEYTGNRINIDSAMPLYDATNEIVAFYYETQPTGYIILRSDDFTLIEGATSSRCEYFSDTSKRYYYTGPLSYFALDEQTGEITNLLTGESATPGGLVSGNSISSTDIERYCASIER